MALPGVSGPSLMDRPTSLTSPPVLYSLVERLRADDRLKEYAAAFPERARVSEPALALLLAALHDELGRGLVVLLAEDADARDAAEGAAWFVGSDRVGLFPSRGVRHGSGLEPPPHLVGERLRALEVLAAGGLVCASAVAVAEGIAPARAAPGDASHRTRRRAGNRCAGRAARARRVRAGRASRGARPLRGARRSRRRVPDHRPRAAPHRAVRGRGRADPRLLAVHAARAAAARPGDVIYPGDRAAPGHGRDRPRPGGGRGGAGPRAGRPRAAVRGRSRSRLAARRRARGLGRGGLRRTAARGSSRAVAVPPGAAVLVRRAASRARGARPVGGRARARRAAPARARRRRLVPTPRRGASPAAAAPPGEAQLLEHGETPDGPLVRRVAGPPRLRLARPRVRAAPGHAGLPQASVARDHRAGACAPELLGSPDGRLRRPRGPRRRAAEELRDEGGGRASRATTCCSPSAATTASTCPTSRSARSAATSAPTRRRRPCPSSAARRGTTSRAVPGSTCARWPAT